MGLYAPDLLPTNPPRRVGCQLILRDELDSTNLYALRRADELADGAVVLAEYQTAGRGRLGRRWESPRGASILLTLLLKEPAGSELVQWLTILAAVATCEAVEAQTTCHPVLRWPNDLALSGKKFGGILVESRSLRRNPPELALAVGIGINCLQQRGHFPGELATTATSLELESSRPIRRETILRALLERLDDRLARFDRPGGTTALLAAWKQRCADFGQRVTLVHDRQTVTGTVVDIGEKGELLVQLDEGGRRYFAPATTTRLR